MIDDEHTNLKSDPTTSLSDDLKLILYYSTPEEEECEMYVGVSHPTSLVCIYLFVTIFLYAFIYTYAQCLYLTEYILIPLM